MPDSLTVHLAAKFDWDDASLELFKKNIFADSFCAGTWPTGRPWGSVTQLLPSTGGAAFLFTFIKGGYWLKKEWHKNTNPNKPEQNRRNLKSRTTYKYR